MKYSPELLNELCGYIEAGNTITDAAILTGIARATVYAWKDGELPKAFLEGLSEEEQTQRKLDVSDNIKKAEIAAKARWLAMIQIDPSWQSKAWLLERKYPNEYGRTVIGVEHSGAVTFNWEEKTKELMDRMGMT